MSESTSLVVRTAQRFGVESSKMLRTLKTTAFKTDQEITDEQMMGLLIVSEQYRLNPFTKELYCLLDKRGGIVPYVGVDGWLRLINEHPQFDGMEIDEAEDGTKCTVTIYRKDRKHPTRITEWSRYCKRDTVPWKQNPPRMIRWKAISQAGRVAFGFALPDEDEARLIVEGSARVVEPTAGLQAMRDALAAPVEPPLPEVEAFDVGDMLKRIKGVKNREQFQQLDDIIGALPEDHPDKVMLIEALEYKDMQMAEGEEREHQDDIIEAAAGRSAGNAADPDDE